MKRQNQNNNDGTSHRDQQDDHDDDSENDFTNDIDVINTSQLKDEVSTHKSLLPENVLLKKNIAISLKAPLFHNISRKSMVGSPKFDSFDYSKENQNCQSPNSINSYIINNNADRVRKKNEKHLSMRNQNSSPSKIKTADVKINGSLIHNNKIRTEACNSSSDNQDNLSAPQDATIHTISKKEEEENDSSSKFIVSVESVKKVFDAVRSGDVNEFDRYILSGCPIDVLEERTDDTPLITSCRLGKNEIVSSALKHQAKNDPHPEFGQTALQAAVSSGQTQCVKLLLDAAAPSQSDRIIANHEDANKEAPLHVASRCGNLEIIELLILHGADMHLVDAQNRTCLHCACQGGHVNVLAYLLDAGGDSLVEERDLHGNTCLHLAVKANADECVLLLLQSAADPRAVVNDNNNKNDTTCGMMNAYQIAVSRRKSSIARLLLEFEPTLKDQHQEIDQTHSDSDGVTSISSVTTTTQWSSEKKAPTLRQDTTLQNEETNFKTADYSQNKSLLLPSPPTQSLKNNSDTFSKSEMYEGLDLYNISFGTRSIATEQRNNFTQEKHSHILPPTPPPRNIGVAARGNYFFDNQYALSTSMSSQPLPYSYTQGNNISSNGTHYQGYPYNNMISNTSSLGSNTMPYESIHMQQGPSNFLGQTALHPEPNSYMYDSKVYVPPQQYNNHMYEQYHHSEMEHMLRTHEWEKKYKKSTKRNRKKTIVLSEYARDPVTNQVYSVKHFSIDNEVWNILYNSGYPYYLRVCDNHVQWTDPRENQTHYLSPNRSTPIKSPKIRYDEDLHSEPTTIRDIRPDTPSIEEKNQKLSSTNRNDKTTDDSKTIDESMFFTPINFMRKSDTKSTSKFPVSLTQGIKQVKLFENRNTLPESKSQIQNGTTVSQYGSRPGIEPINLGCEVSHNETEKPTETNVTIFDPCNTNSSISIKKSDISNLMDEIKGRKSHVHKVVDKVQTESMGETEVTLIDSDTSDDPEIKKYSKMVSVGVPVASVIHKMQMEGVDEAKVANFEKKHSIDKGLSSPKPSEKSSKKTVASDDPEIKKYSKMVSVGVPVASVIHKMQMEGVDEAKVANFEKKHSIGKGLSSPKPSEKSSKKTVASDDPEIKKYSKMVSVGVPVASVIHKMRMEGVDEAKVANFEKKHSIDKGLSSPKPSEKSSKKTVASDDPEIKKYSKMVSVGVPVASVIHKMQMEGVDEAKVANFKKKHSIGKGLSSPKPSGKSNKKTVASDDPEIKKYSKMVSVGVPVASVIHKMQMEGVESAKIDILKQSVHVDNHSVFSPAITKMEKSLSNSRRCSVEMQKIHWNTVSEDNVEDSIWEGDCEDELDQTEIEELEALFRSQPAKISMKDNRLYEKEKQKQKQKQRKQNIQLIDMKRANNVAIALAQFRAFKNFDDLCQAVISLDEENLNCEKLQNMELLLPSLHEKKAIQRYTGDNNDLGQAEKWFISVLKISRFELKLHGFKFSLQFAELTESLCKSLDILKCACNEILSSKKLASMLRRLLSIGNLMNESSGRPKAKGITIDSLIKTANKKGSDGKTSVLDHIVYKVMKQKDDKEEKIIDFWQDMPSVRETARLDIKDCETNYRELLNNLNKVERTVSVEKSDNEAHPKTNIFIQKAGSFSVKARVVLGDVEMKMKEVDDGVKKLCKFFAENENTKTSVIFNVLKDFSLLVNQSKERFTRYEEGRKRKEKLMLLKNKKMQSKNVAFFEPGVSLKGSKVCVPNDTESIGGESYAANTVAFLSKNTQK